VIVFVGRQAYQVPGILSFVGMLRLVVCFARRCLFLLRFLILFAFSWLLQPSFFVLFAGGGGVWLQHVGSRIW
jgi:hypothetical protein